MQDGTAKKCTKCTETKPVNEFYPDSRNPGKYRAICRTCTSAYNKARNHTGKAAAIRADRARRAALAEKPCRTCDTVKPLNQFHVARENADGRQTECSSCTSLREYARRGVVPGEYLNQHNPKRTAERFRKAVEAAGGEQIGPYTNIDTPVHIVCREGHNGYPMPNNVLSGTGICAACAGKVWDVFYVVASDSVVKFGITSGNPRPRLYDHRKNGLPEVLRLLTGLPVGAAKWLEDQCLAVLREEGATPVRGREYFDVRWTSLITDIFDRFS